jgi:hypothetical protein
MRIGLIVAGIVLILAGAAAFTGMLDFTQDKQVVKVGPVSASVKEEKTVPQWLGARGVVAGLGLVVAGAVRR